MPSLDEILKKSKNVAKINFVRKPLSIATEDRPDSLAKKDQSSVVEAANKLNTSSTQEKLLTIREHIVSNELAIREHTNSIALAMHEHIEKEIKQERDTKWEQTGNKSGTNKEQIRNNKKPVNQNWEQSGYTTGNKQGNKPGTNKEQTGNKASENISFSGLVGLQRNIIIFIYYECKNSRSKVTGTLTLEHIAKSIECSTETAKTTLKRLKKKGCLMRVESKNGRGGWSQYELPDNIYHEVLRNETENKLGTNWEQTGNKVGTQPGTEPGTNPSSSSDLSLLKTTTNLSDEWNFDITPYSRFGFTASHIKQIATLGIISAADVEQSLIEFSHDLDNNALPKIKTNKLNFLMGLLRVGQSYVSEGFRNEQEAIISEMARRAEGRRKNLLEERFLSWEAGLSGDDRKAIDHKLPTQLMVLNRTHGISNPEVKNWLFNYFIQQDKLEI